MGGTMTLYPADVLMVTAGLRTVRALLLMARPSTRLRKLGLTSTP